MTFDEYWQQLRRQNESLRRDDEHRFSLTVANFRKALKQAWELSS